LDKHAAMGKEGLFSIPLNHGYTRPVNHRKEFRMMAWTEHSITGTDIRKIKLRECIASQA